MRGDRTDSFEGAGAFEGSGAARADDGFTRTGRFRPDVEFSISEKTVRTIVFFGRQVDVLSVSSPIHVPGERAFAAQQYPSFYCIRHTARFTPKITYVCCKNQYILDRIIPNTFHMLSRTTALTATHTLSCGISSEYCYAMYSSETLFNNKQYKRGIIMSISE